MRKTVATDAPTLPERRPYYLGAVAGESASPLDVLEGTGAAARAAIDLGHDDLAIVLLAVARLANAYVHPPRRGTASSLNEDAHAREKRERDEADRTKAHRASLLQDPLEWARPFLSAGRRRRRGGAPGTADVGPLDRGELMKYLAATPLSVEGFEAIGVTTLDAATSLERSVDAAWSELPPLALATAAVGTIEAAVNLVGLPDPGDLHCRVAREIHATQKRSKVSQRTATADTFVAAVLRGWSQKAGRSNFARGAIGWCEFTRKRFGLWP